MVGQWNAESLFLYAITRTTFPITATSTYTVGTGGTVNTARPSFIQAVNFIDTNPTIPTEYQLGDPLSDAGYQSLVLKTLTSPFPTDWYYNPTMPLGTLFLWPQPTSATLTGVMYASQVVPAFAGLTTTVVLPDGYEELIVTNLAMRLCGPYTKPVDPSLRERATEAKAIAKRSNAKLVDMSFEAGCLAGNSGPWNSFSIYTGP